MGAETGYHNYPVGMSCQFISEKLARKLGFVQKPMMKIKTRALQRFRAKRSHCNTFLSPPEIERKLIEISKDRTAGWFPKRLWLWHGEL